MFAVVRRLFTSCFFMGKSCVVWGWEGPEPRVGKGFGGVAVPWVWMWAATPTEKSLDCGRGRRGNFGSVLVHPLNLVGWVTVGLVRMFRFLSFHGWPALPAMRGFGLAAVFGGWVLMFPECGVSQDATAAISYQGRLLVGGRSATGLYDFQFLLMDSATGGQALGQTLAQTLMVAQGVFTTSLSFGVEYFNGSPRWVEVRVRPSPSGGTVADPYAVLERQPLFFAPYAVRSLTASTVTAVPVQSLPASVPIKNADGKLDSSLLGADIARAADVVALQQAVASLQTQLAALTQENVLLRQSVDAAAAPVRSGWMVASADPADPALIGAGFTRAFSTPEPAWLPASTVSAPSARLESSGVWTGQEWLIWGGRGIGQVALATGAGYRPNSDAWVEIGAADAPEARSGHTAVWTGAEMLVWGGFGRTNLNTGGRFSRGSLSWQAMATLNAPVARQGHGAVWTGRAMAVFGGRNASGLLNDGGLYDPVLDRWTALPTTQAPSARSGATVLWTGVGVLVWGGETAAGGDASGAFLRFDANGNPLAWESMPALSGFVTRSGHVAAWDGQRLMVWGGRGSDRQLLSDGAILELSTGKWTRMSGDGAPTARHLASGVWTGDELLVFGGQDMGGPAAGGHAWRRSSGTWRALPASIPPVARVGGLAAWTGTELLLFGGQGGNASVPMAQGQRLAAAASWHFFRRDPN